VSKHRKEMHKGADPASMRISEELPYTEEEIRVARLCVEGLSDKEIADVLHITPEAVGALKEIITAKARSINRGC